MINKIENNYNINNTSKSRSFFGGYPEPLYSNLIIDSKVSYKRDKYEDSFYDNSCNYRLYYIKKMGMKQARKLIEGRTSKKSFADIDYLLNNWEE